LIGPNYGGRRNHGKKIKGFSKKDGAQRTDGNTNIFKAGDRNKIGRVDETSHPGRWFVGGERDDGTVHDGAEGRCKTRKGGQLGDCFTPVD